MNVSGKTKLDEGAMRAMGGERIKDGVYAVEVSGGFLGFGKRYDVYQKNGEGAYSPVRRGLTHAQVKELGGKTARP